MVYQAESFNYGFDRSVDAKDSGASLAAGIWRDKSLWTAAQAESKLVGNEDVSRILSNFSIGDKPFDMANQRDLLGPEKIKEMEQN